MLKELYTIYLFFKSTNLKSEIYIYQGGRSLRKKKCKLLFSFNNASPMHLMWPVETYKSYIEDHFVCCVGFIYSLCMHLVYVKMCYTMNMTSMIKKKQQQKTNIYSFLTNPTIKILFLDFINSNLGIYDLWIW